MMVIGQRPLYTIVGFGLDGANANANDIVLSVIGQEDNA